MASPDDTAITHEYRDVDVADQEWGSDVIADVLKALGFEFVSFNPGASFRGIEESIVNYNDNTPTVIEAQHEGLSVSIAHGYAKATGEPAVCALHNAVGTLNGAMNIYNAFADGAPVLILGGNGPLRKSRRRPWIDWIHSTLDQAGLVRDITKWGDEPVHSDGVCESMIRAFNRANTRPYGPTYVTMDHEVQENSLDAPVEIPDLDRMGPPTRLGPDPAAIDDAADRLLDADLPVIMTDDVGKSREAVDALVDLAETLGAPVVDLPKHHRFNFPNNHPLSLSGSDVFTEADLLLALDVRSHDYLLKTADQRTHAITELVSDDVPMIDIGMQDIEISSVTADYCRLREVDLSIQADTAIAIPALLDAVEARMDATARDRAEERTAEMAARHEDLRADWRAQAEAEWAETPISHARVAAEVWDVIQDDSWVLAGRLRGWPHRLWDIEEWDQFVGGHSGGGGVGYGVGGAIGTALAYSDSDRATVNFQPDGDLMQFLNGLWTMAHYELPILNVVNNNGTLYNSTKHRMELAAHRGRDESYERALIGTGIHDPQPNYAAVAEGLGVTGYGPVEDPDALGDVLAEAWRDVSDGQPVLVDVVTQDE